MVTGTIPDSGKKEERDTVRVLDSSPTIARANRRFPEAILTAPSGGVVLFCPLETGAELELGQGSAPNGWMNFILNLSSSLRLHGHA